jgi:signal transduction histidine kinase
MGDWVAFEVTDNGIGVPPAMRRRIFERFTRVEGPGRGKAGGHGLGLAFVQESALAHGGLVECLDGLEGGSRFRLKLKRAR